MTRPLFFEEKIVEERFFEELFFEEIFEGAYTSAFFFEE
jgi:hypothetical protein